ncbi:hypothetical protein DFJ77DRAFT_477663 [Powellomyces hirtus]|nr:hypothetical protein DFJ77DRAFT_477663 [Powellomyces hirtus]
MYKHCKALYAEFYWIPDEVWETLDPEKLELEFRNKVTQERRNEIVNDIIQAMVEAEVRTWKKRREQCAEEIRNSPNVQLPSLYERNKEYYNITGRIPQQWELATRRPYLPSKRENEIWYKTVYTVAEAVTRKWWEELEQCQEARKKEASIRRRRKENRRKSNSRTGTVQKPRRKQKASKAAQDAVSAQVHLEVAPAVESLEQSH